MQLAGQRTGQIEAEAIDVHLGHPVAQRVHHQFQHLGVHHVQRVAGAGEIHVVTRVIGHLAVVSGVVDAFHRKHRAQAIAFAGVVVDHVENDFDARLVQSLHHFLELGHLLACVA